MDILITGQLGAVSYSFCDKLSEHSKVIAASGDVREEYIGNIHKVFSYEIGTDEYNRLFNIYSFDAMVYFLDEPNISGADFEAVGRLDAALSDCAKFDVKKVILVSSTYVYSGEIAASEDKSISMTDNYKVLLSSCEELCESYRDNCGISVMVLHTPIFYGMGENKSFFGRMIHQSATKNYVNVSGAANQVAEVLSLDDLGELVARILLDWSDDIHTMNVPGADIISLSQLSNLLSGTSQVTRITYSDKPAQLGPPVASEIARNEYDFVPVVKITDDFDQLIKNICVFDEDKKATLKSRISSFLSSKSFIIIAIELALGYILMEILNNLSNTAVQFKVVDFRLLFIVIIATVHGLKPGIAASILSCFSAFAAYISSGMEWQMIAYNINYWLPFACYITAGAIIGYTKDKKDKTIEFVSEEKETLEKRYVFQSELYDNALYNKDQYKRQIMSYRGSFGRLFDVTRRLNSVLPDSIFKEALLALEDVLDNQTVVIYNTTGSKGYARLCVCSKKIIGNTRRSINLNDFENIINNIKKDEVWVNLERYSGYPDYAFPVFREGKLASLIFINKVSYEQMSMYFENLVKIICNLIEDSLVRAIDYNEKFSDEMYISGSNVLKKEPFKEILRIREEMEQDAIAEYSILRIEANSENIVAIASRLENYFRENDVFGQGEDNNLYIILSGTNANELNNVVKRLEARGVFSGAK